MTLKDLLSKKMTKKQLALAPSSFDVIGSKEKAVAIVEVPVELKSKKIIIAEAIMKLQKSVVTVLEKASPRKGVFRTRRLKIIKGSRNTEVIHKESGCRFFLDPRKTYFSQREGTERLRVSKLVKKDETVMVFFSGISAFSIVIAKKTKVKNVIGIEINPDAVEYAKKNIGLNKTPNIEAVLGDVKKKASNYAGKCDHVFMPLPESSIEYLEEAKRVSKKNGIIHMYFFSAESELREVKKQVKEKLIKARITKITKVLSYGPGIWKYRMDVKL
jgi:tRNA (guanine37-N1)-methyltransferase